jgi:CRP-like cAMP-binding protein/CheY-like chemotaxis protein
MTPDAMLRPEIELLDPSTRALLDDPKCVERVVPAGARLLRKGEQSRGLEVIRSGWAARYKSLADGRQQILAFLLPGDLVDVQSEIAGAAVTSIVAITDVTLHSHEIDASEPMSNGLGAVVAVEKVRTEEAMLSLGQRNAVERAAALLLELFDRAAARGMVVAGSLAFPLTQKHLSAALGISVVHVNRVVGSLQRAGMIRLHRSRLEIADLQRLAATAQRPPSAFALAAVSGDGAIGDVDRSGRTSSRGVPAKRILLVEDEFHLARHVAEILQQMGLEVVGPVGSLAEATHLIETQSLDAALLDVRLQHRLRVYPAAEILRRRKIPFSFMTAYSDHDIERFPTEPVLRKPFRQEQLESAVGSLVH